MHSTALARGTRDMPSWVLGRDTTPIFGSILREAGAGAVIYTAEGTEPDTRADSQNAPKASKLDQQNQ